MRNAKQGNDLKPKKSIAVDEEEQNRWKSETSIEPGENGIESKRKDEPEEPDSLESWKNLAGRAIVAGEVSFFGVGFVTEMCDFGISHASFFIRRNVNLH